MTAFIIYIIKWAFALTLLYSLYGLFLRRETFHRINRMVLLFILTSSMVLPFCNIKLEHSNPITEGAQRLEQVVKEEAERKSLYATQMVQDAEEDKVAEAYDAHPSTVAKTHDEAENVSSSSSFPWLKVLLGIYLVGLIMHLLRYLWDFVMLTHIIYKGERVEVEGIPQRYHVIMTPRAAMPMSWMRWILVNEQDLQEPCLLQHELAHLRKGHSWDLLLSELTARLQWFNPLAWMLCHDLRDIHEYEVDRDLVNEGTDREAYGRIIIERGTHPALQSVTNGLKHSLIKDRLKMLYTQPSGQFAWLKVLYLVPLICLAVIAFAKPNMINEIKAQLLPEDNLAELEMQNISRWEEWIKKEREEYVVKKQNADNMEDASYYLYSPDGEMSNMCELLVLQWSDTTGHCGYLYGNSDEFDRKREGYMPGYFVQRLEGESKDGKLGFQMDMKGKAFLNAPVELKYRSHFEALTQDFYEGWKEKTIVSQDVIYSGRQAKDGSIELSNNTYPYKEGTHLFKPISKEEARKYGKELLSKTLRKKNAYKPQYDAGVTQEYVFVVNGGKAYHIFEQDGDNFVCYAQEYTLLPAESGFVRLYSAKDRCGYVRPTNIQYELNMTLPQNYLRTRSLDEIDVYEHPDAKSRLIGQIKRKSGRMYDYYPCLGLENGFFKIEWKEKTGYVLQGLMSWTPLGIY